MTILAGRVKPTLQLTIHGTPTTPGAKPTELQAWREAIRDVATPHDGAYMAKEPLQVVANFTIPKPLTAPKTRRLWPTTQPTETQLMKVLRDTLRDSGVYDNDAQLVDVRVTKSYPGEGPGLRYDTGAIIKITSLAGIPLPNNPEVS